RDGGLTDLVKGSTIADGFSASELGGEFDALFKDVGFLLLRHLVGALAFLEQFVLSGATQEDKEGEGKIKRCMYFVRITVQTYLSS
ncbi:MAG: hypothetical protein Q9216_005826, partial [Gyalolechia sp. 2 TL-2023]